MELTSLLRLPEFITVHSLYVPMKNESDMLLIEVSKSDHWLDPALKNMNQKSCQWDPEKYTFIFMLVAIE